jgi:hypothetical protein
MPWCVRRFNYSRRRASIVGAVIGGVVGYWFLTDHGKASRVSSSRGSMSSFTNSRASVRRSRRRPVSPMQTGVCCTRRSTGAGCMVRDLHVVIEGLLRSRPAHETEQGELGIPRTDHVDPRSGTLEKATWHIDAVVSTRTAQAAVRAS